MTISTAPTPLSYAGNGSTTSFPISWKYNAKSHVIATLRSSSGTETVWVLTTNYTLTDPGDTGTLTAVVAPVTGTTLLITLEPPNTQTSDIPLGGAFPSVTVEDGLDLSAQRDAKIESLFLRALRVPKTDTKTGSSLEIPIDTARASKFLAFDAAGVPIASVGTSDNLGPVSAFIDTLLDDTTAAAARATLGELTPVVATLAALKDLSGSNLIGYVFMAARTTAGDGGDGLFRWVAASAAVANDGTIVTPTAGGGRFYRVYDSGTLNVRWFGAIGDGVADDTVAIQATINATETLGGTVLFTAGTFKITATIQLPSDVILCGVGKQATTIKGAIGLPLIANKTPAARIYRCGVRDLCVDNTDRATAGGIGIDFVNVTMGMIENCVIKNVLTGIRLGLVCYYNSIISVDVVTVNVGIDSQNGANENKIICGRVNESVTGIRIDGASNTVVFGVAIEVFTTGVTIAPVNACQYIKVTGCRFENASTSGTGVLIGALAQASFVAWNQLTSLSTAIDDLSASSCLWEDVNFKLSGGTSIRNHWSAKVVIDFGSIAANTAVDSALQSAGVLANVSATDSVFVSAPATIGTGLMLLAIPAAGGVYIRAANVTVGAIDPPSLTFTIDVWRHN